MGQPFAHTEHDCKWKKKIEIQNWILRYKTEQPHDWSKLEHCDSSVQKLTGINVSFLALNCETYGKNHTNNEPKNYYFFQTQCTTKSPFSLTTDCYLTLPSSEEKQSNTTRHNMWITPAGWFLNPDTCLRYMIVFQFVLSSSVIHLWYLRCTSRSARTNYINTPVI